MANGLDLVSSRSICWSLANRPCSMIRYSQKKILTTHSRKWVAIVRSQMLRPFLTQPPTSEIRLLWRRMPCYASCVTETALKTTTLRPRAVYKPLQQIFFVVSVLYSRAMECGTGFKKWDWYVSSPGHQLAKTLIYVSVITDLERRKEDAVLVRNLRAWNTRPKSLWPGTKTVRLGPRLSMVETGQDLTYHFRDDPNHVFPLTDLHDDNLHV